MSHDTDDVLDFINSLPESKAAAACGEADSSDDFLEFLDELSAHEKGTSEGKPKFEPKKTDARADFDKTPAATLAEPADAEAPAKATVAATKSPATKSPATTSPATTSPAGSGAAAQQKPTSAEKYAQEPAVLDSISSWWSTEGSSKVTSLWGSLTSNAHQLSESTYQLASNTSNQLSHQRQKLLKEHPGVDTDQIVHITDKLNSMLSTMSQQIKDGLADKEDEVLNVFLVYDLNINYLDSLCASKFDKVMGQVEGGIRTSVSNFNHKHEQTAEKHYDLGMFHGKSLDGEKLCHANLESSIKDYLNITQVENKSLVSDELSGEINTSNVFIAIQPITTGVGKADEAERDASAPVVIEASNADSFSFTFILKDISNNITIISKSQPFPARWARWIAGHSEDVDAVFNAGEEGDAVDPSEWVQDWIHDGLGLSFAVLAQEYVTKRMGI